MPAFGTILTDDQLTALSAFLEEPGDQAPADRTGESIYMDHCRVCHGDNGVGGSGPSLLTAGLGSEEIAVVVADGQGSMPAFSDQLSAGERETVAEFVTTFTPAVTTSSTAPVDVSGEGIYVTACSACHGPTGEGGAGPALQGATLTQPDLVAVITAGRGSMPAFSSLLSAEEIDAVAGFATTLTPTSTVSTAPSVISGGEIFAGTCARCHGSAGAGGEGPTLAGTALSANEIVVVVWSGHPGMPAFHETLTADEIVAVSVYAASLQALEPADGQDDSEIRSIPIALGVAVVLIAILGFAMIRRKLTARRN